MKKLLSLVLALIMVFTLIGCRGNDDPATDPTDDASAVDPSTPVEDDDANGDDDNTEGDDDNSDAEEGDWKIGIITGTVSQNEEEFQAAMKMVDRHGSDRVLTATYPDKFSDEIETTIAQALGLAEQGVEAIVFCQGVPGTIASIEKVRETHPEMMFVIGVVQETPSEVAAIADVCMLVDELGMGVSVIEQAKAQGAEKFIHYSFPRHLGMETIARRRELFMQTCEELGIEYIDVTAPDPTGDSGTSGAQQFILEDVPRQIEEHGTETAFFSTNCSMQEPLIRSVLEQGAIYPQQCCPSPYHGLPGALNISTKGHEGDVQYMLDQATDKVVEGGNAGRMSTWPVPVNMLMIEAGADYAIRWLQGEFTDRFDDAEMRKSIDTVAAEYGATATLTLYDDNGTDLENFYMIMCDYYNFG